MESTFIALLRGVNVGKAKRIAMADLRSLIADLGFADVRTLLNSGNVVFRGATKSTPEIAVAIEKAILAKCGFSSRVSVLTAAELARIVDENPLIDSATDAARYLVAVLQDAAELKLLEPILARDFSPERVIPGTRVVYLWCARGILESGMLKLIVKCFGERATTRNWVTICKLLALAKP